MLYIFCVWFLHSFRCSLLVKGESALLAIIMWICSSTIARVWVWLWVSLAAPLCYDYDTKVVMATTTTMTIVVPRKITQRKFLQAFVLEPRSTFVRSGWMFQFPYYSDRWLATSRLKISSTNKYSSKSQQPRGLCVAAPILNSHFPSNFVIKFTINSVTLSYKQRYPLSVDRRRMSAIRVGRMFFFFSFFRLPVFRA